MLSSLQVAPPIPIAHRQMLQIHLPFVYQCLCMFVIQALFLSLSLSLSLVVNLVSDITWKLTCSLNANIRKEFVIMMKKWKNKSLLEPCRVDYYW